MDCQITLYFQFARISRVLLNIALLSEETVKLFESEILKKIILVTAQINPEIVVFADENMLKTILRNLFSNAIKFTFEGAKISI
jgi:two-component system, sensor histidine kinase and response regulator